MEDLQAQAECMFILSLNSIKVRENLHSKKWICVIIFRGIQEIHTEWFMCVDLNSCQSSPNVWLSIRSGGFGMTSQTSELIYYIQSLDWVIYDPVLWLNQHTSWRVQYYYGLKMELHNFLLLDIFCYSVLYYHINGEQYQVFWIYKLLQ